MMEDPRNITPCTHLLFIAKNLERIGDHATNIAEIVHFQVEGEALAERRPKADASNYTVLGPEDIEDEDDLDDDDDDLDGPDLDDGDADGGGDDDSTSS